jgi:hypothetical protein
MQCVIYFTFVSVKLKSIEQECLFLFITKNSDEEVNLEASRDNIIKFKRTR